MRARLICAVAALGLAAPLIGTAPVASGAAPRTVAAADGWTLVFQDSFGNPTKSAEKWSNTAERPLPTGQCWSFRKVSGATAVVIPSRLPWEDAPNVSCRMATNDPFGGATHKFSARVKFHRAQGTLSSFWVTGAGPNEIDVIENAGKKPGQAPCVLPRDRDNPITKDDESADRFYGLMHNVYQAYLPSVGHRACVAQSVAYPRYDDRYHTVTAIWRPGVNVVFQVDGRTTATYGKKWSRTSPVNALLTNKSNNPNKVGFVVDWVKVWKRS